MASCLDYQLPYFPKLIDNNNFLESLQINLVGTKLYFVINSLFVGREHQNQSSKYIW